MAVHEGYISVTPLQVDLTNYKLLQESYVPSFNWP
jgi:broad specificity polyphosphatase/5'/3'-nucleotidase SurE